MNRELMPTESIGKVDLLLGRATMLTADRWDDVASMINEAMGSALLMAATHPSSRPVDVPGLAGLDALSCVEQSLREVQSLDLALAADLPDLARLRVLLADVRTALDATAGPRG
jgi:hypothetical protein